MNHLLLCAAMLLGVSLTAQAQLLPVPGARNPDWTLTTKVPGSRPSRPDSLAGSRDPMPIVDPTRRGTTDNMPNALAGSISGFGTTRRYWDAARKLAYEWQSSAGRTTPDSVVTVHQQATGATYVYRKRPKVAKYAQGIRVIPSAPK